MRRFLLSCLVLLAASGAAVDTTRAGGQGYPNGAGQVPGRGGMGGQPGMGPLPSESSPAPVEKPDSAAKKAFAAGLKALNRAKEYEDVAAKAPNSDKKAAAMDKVGEAYDKALDQFTEVLRNKGDMVDAWNYVGYIHLHVGAYREAIDDYNHTLALKADFLEATLHRAEAYVAVDRLDEAQTAYMDLFNHARPLADQLLVVMRKWLDNHRAAANGVRAADIDSFDRWLQEREGIAKQTASAASAAH